MKGGGFRSGPAPVTRPSAGEAAMSKIHVLHESREWFRPLGTALDAFGLPHEEIFLDGGMVDLSAAPPAGIFFNRLSASAHTRQHPFAVDQARAILRWLEAHGRRVVNGVEALELAMSKAALIAALNAAGITTPRSRAVAGFEGLVEAARGFPGPFLVKPNRSGKGIGIELFADADELARRIDQESPPASVDGIYLIQEYLPPRDPFITRVEFVGGKPLYALRSDTRQGFNLCPADYCNLDAGKAQRFSIERDFDHPILRLYQSFLRGRGVEIAAIEFLVDRSGRPYTYDLNINTNYNAEAEAAAGVSGMRAIAEFLGRTLQAEAIETRASAA
jgi:hypothetical protein